MHRLTITLLMDLRHNAVEGPGWYVYAASDEHNMLGPISISKDGAKAIGEAFQHGLMSSGGSGAIAVPELVESGNGLIRTEVQKQLEEAERLAAMIPSLRKRLQAEEAATVSE